MILKGPFQRKAFYGSMSINARSKLCGRYIISLSCHLLFTICSHSFAVQKYITVCFSLLNSRLLPLRPMLQVQSKAFN